MLRIEWIAHSMGRFSTLFSRSKRIGGGDPPRVPPDERYYVIGDIHGRSDLLKLTLASIFSHMNAHPIAKPHVVFLGDYVDRGPDTCGVLDIMSGFVGREDVILLSGNHEEFMSTALADASAMNTWLWAGGREALLSYDVRVPMNASNQDLLEAHADAKLKVPEHHVVFLQSLKPYHVAGDYAFVHAGIRPGIALEHQSARDLMWIREEFVTFSGLHSHIIVHGHTPVEEPDIRPNRINIDTGAYISGALTCLVLEGGVRVFL